MCWVALYSVLHHVHFIGLSISYLFSLSEFTYDQCVTDIVLLLFRSLSLIVFVPVLTSFAKNHTNRTIEKVIRYQENLNMAGFILITVIQTLTVKIILCGL